MKSQEVEVLVGDIVPAGAMAGMSRAQSYRSAKRWREAKDAGEAPGSGDIPTIKVGDRFKVPLKLWRRILDGDLIAPLALLLAVIGWA